MALLDAPARRRALLQRQQASWVDKYVSPNRVKELMETWAIIFGDEHQVPSFSVTSTAGREPAEKALHFFLSSDERTEELLLLLASEPRFCPPGLSQDEAAGEVPLSSLKLVRKRLLLQPDKSGPRPSTLLDQLYVQKHQYYRQKMRYMELKLLRHNVLTNESTDESDEDKAQPRLREERKPLRFHLRQCTVHVYSDLRTDSQDSAVRQEETSALSVPYPGPRFHQCLLDLLLLPKGWSVADGVAEGEPLSIDTVRLALDVLSAMARVVTICNPSLDLTVEGDLHLSWLAQRVAILVECRRIVVFIGKGENETEIKEYACGVPNVALSQIAENYAELLIYRSTKK